MLRWLKARVTFTVCSLNTSLSGGGRKSSMTSDCSMASATAFGALRYFVFLFIHLLPFSPQSCTKDARSHVSDRQMPVELLQMRHCAWIGWLDPYRCPTRISLSTFTIHSSIQKSIF